jgi:hypothetical protein
MILYHQHQSNILSTKIRIYQLTLIESDFVFLLEKKIGSLFRMKTISRKVAKNALHNFSLVI